MDKIAKILLIATQSHPWTMMRVSEIIKWFESEKYQEIITIHGKDSIE
jgi:hypothetical protein